MHLAAASIVTMDQMGRLQTLEDQTLDYLDNLQQLLDLSSREILEEAHERTMETKLQSCIDFIQESGEELAKIIATLPPPRVFRYDKSL